MNRILLATVDRARLKEFAEAMATGGEVQIAWADSGTGALADVMAHPPLAVIVDVSLPDMVGLELVRRLLPINAMIHTAVISELPEERFHEMSEGLGVLAQLPSRPTAAQATELLGRLKRLAPDLRFIAGTAPHPPGAEGGGLFVRQRVAQAAYQACSGVVRERDFISHSSTVSLSATCSQPQIMARVWAPRLWPVVIM